MADRLFTHTGVDQGAEIQEFDGPLQLFLFSLAAEPSTGLADRVCKLVLCGMAEKLQLGALNVDEESESGGC